MNSPILRRIALLLGVVLCFVMLLMPLGGADFGDFGGDSDSGDSDSGGWDSDYDSDYDYSDRQNHKSSENQNGFRRVDGTVEPSSDTYMSLIYAALLYGAIFLCLAIVKKSWTSSTKSSNAARQYIKPQIPFEKYIEEYDPDLNKEQLELWIEKLYCDMQVGWEGGNIENVRDRFDADAWNRFNQQLINKNDKKETGHTRGITFKAVKPIGVTCSGNVDTLYVKLIVELNLWQTREDRIVSNDPSTLTYMTYEWALTRAAGIKSKSNAYVSMQCPNCGKEVDLNAFAVCPFCGTQLSRSGVTWVLANISAINQETISYSEQRSETPAETAARIVAEAEEKGIHL